MERRLQVTSDDAVLEITETQPVKRRLSEKKLLRRKKYLELSLEHFQASLSDCESKLALITTAKNEKGKK